MERAVVPWASSHHSHKTLQTQWRILVILPSLGRPAILQEHDDDHHHSCSTAVHPWNKKWQLYCETFHKTLSESIFQQSCKWSLVWHCALIQDYKYLSKGDLNISFYHQTIRSKGHWDWCWCRLLLRKTVLESHLHGYHVLHHSLCTTPLVKRKLLSVCEFWKCNKCSLVLTQHQDCTW